jgi:hypothetical protein
MKKLCLLLLAAITMTSCTSKRQYLEVYCTYPYAGCSFKRWNAGQELKDYNIISVSISECYAGRGTHIAVVYTK